MDYFTTTTADTNINNTYTYTVPPYQTFNYTIDRDAINNVLWERLQNNVHLWDFTISPNSGEVYMNLSAQDDEDVTIQEKDFEDSEELSEFLNELREKGE